MAFTINTKEFVKIWFSRDPSVFMNFTNQLRMIRFRNTNKTAKITLIYSSKMLHEQANKDFLRFCKQYNIIPWDFDTALKKVINRVGSREEKELLQLADQELENTLLGNVAAASDIVRLLRPVLRRGIYSDVDFEFDFSTLPKEIIINGALLLNVGFSCSKDTGRIQAKVTNNFIGLARENFSRFPKPDELISIQQALIFKYKDKDYRFKGRSLLSYAEEKINNTLIQKKPGNVFEVRKECFFYFNVKNLVSFFLEEILVAMQSGKIETMPSFYKDLMKIVDNKKMLNEFCQLEKIIKLFVINFLMVDPSFLDMNYGEMEERLISLINRKFDIYEQFIEFLSQNILKELVIKFSGPNIITEGINAHLGREGVADRAKSFEDRYCIYKNPLLTEFAQNTYFVMTPEKMETMGGSDLYWLESAKTEFDKKEQKMVKAASSIQVAYRGYRKKQTKRAQHVSANSEKSALLLLRDDSEEQDEKPWYKKFCCF